MLFITNTKELMFTHFSDSSCSLLTPNLNFYLSGKGNTSKSSGVAEELEEQIKAGAIG